MVKKYSAKKYQPRRTPGKLSVTGRWPLRKAKTVMGFLGPRRSIAAPRNVTKFLRWTATQDLVTFDSGTYLGLANNVDNPSVTIPLQVTGGAMSATTSGVANNYICGGAMQFRITDVPNYTDFTNLFDQYRIDQVDIEISNIFNTASVGNTLAGTVMPSIMYAPDFDDAVIPTTAASLMDRQRAKQWTFRGSGNPLRFSVKPRLANLTYRTGGTTVGYTVAPDSTWINQSFTDVPYYGCKIWFSDLFQQSSQPTGQTHLRVKMRYHISCKDPE
jgi:hypothetical protein